MSTIEVNQEKIEMTVEDNGFKSSVIMELDGTIKMSSKSISIEGEE